MALNENAIEGIITAHQAMLAALMRTHPNPKALLEAFGREISRAIELENSPHVQAVLLSYETTFRDLLGDLANKGDR